AEVVTDPEPLAPPAELLTDAADRAEAETAAPASVADAADTLPAEAVASASLSAESADDTASITTGPLVDMPVELIPPLPDTQISTMAASGQAASAPQIAEINEVADVIRSRYGDAPESVHKVELPPSLD
ncbi:MAG: hypothetical protein LIP23_06150, partial [Planctomycetes bacterium]|nr:hypothetical protein [Planctomycetota bacterium]